MSLDGKSVLITGGTGSFGKEFIQTVLGRYNVKKMIIYSRDELKQSEMKHQYPSDQYRNVRFFIGDVRDKERLVMACENVDVIIHAAALKQVDTAEYNPGEFIKTNISGAENVIHAARTCGISDVVALSTDKACAPVNLYGATKLVSDKLFVAANNFRGYRDLKISVVRYGNVLGSRGSVIPHFINKRSEGVLNLTDTEMTRFNILLTHGVEMVLFALNNHLGGEIFVPKIPSYKILDVVEAVAPECRTVVTGIRPGEKLHEEMITTTDSLNTVDLGDYYAILPAVSLNVTSDEYLRHHNATPVPKGFAYNSNSNSEWETVESLRLMIKDQLGYSYNE
jgi:UDP-N-acetylglucosamine 4,6-dehydratase/5-epimerase